MPKNIVICCDGTNGQFSLQNTNVVRLYSLLDHGPLRQATFYDPGLGTMGAMGAWTPWAQQFTKLLGLAFGYGLKDRIGCAYEHLMSAYEEGDRIYLFGFSRGAYTVRALAALLHMFGLIRKGNENLVPYVTNMFGRGSEQVFALARRFKPAFSRECPIHFLGLWDTVKSVGWIYDPKSLPYTTDNPSVSIVRHAVSIDERRCFFRQNLWKASPGQDVQQLWFAGVHSDVGGGYPENQNGLANIALRWMLDEAHGAGLLLDEARVAAELARPEFQPDPAGTIHESLAGPWWILEFWPKRHMDMRRDPPVEKWEIPFGARRYVRTPAAMHPSVRQRMDAVVNYRPANLPRDVAVQ